MDYELIDAIPGFAFWREGCFIFAKRLSQLIELARGDSEMTDEQLFQLIRTLPRSPSDLSSPEWQKEFCSRCLKKAHERSPHGEETVKYFLHYFPNRNYTAQTMLIDAFVGFISGVEEAVKELEGNHERAPLPRLRPDDG